MVLQAILDADLTDTLPNSWLSRTEEYTNGSNWGALPLDNDAGQPLSYSRSYNYAPSWTFYDWNVDEYFADIKQKLW
jgi:outer membrane receptor for ferric coprogen and ferric-rhodotorulic acid